MVAVKHFFASAFHLLSHLDLSLYLFVLFLLFLLADAFKGIWDVGGAHIKGDEIVSDCVQGLRDSMLATLAVWAMAEWT